MCFFLGLLFLDGGGGGGGGGIFMTEGWSGCEQNVVPILSGWEQNVVPLDTLSSEHLCCHMSVRACACACVCVCGGGGGCMYMCMASV